MFPELFCFLYLCCRRTRRMGYASRNSLDINRDVQNGLKIYKLVLPKRPQLCVLEKPRFSQGRKMPKKTLLVVQIWCCSDRFGHIAGMQIALHIQQACFRSVGSVPEEFRYSRYSTGRLRGQTLVNFRSEVWEEGEALPPGNVCRKGLEGTQCPQ